MENIENLPIRPANRSNVRGTPRGPGVHTFRALNGEYQGVARS